MKIKKTAIILCSITLLLIACTKENKKTDSIEGIWQSIGYGRILNIESAKYAIYDITQISCLPEKEGSISELEGAMEVKNDTLSFKVGFDVYYYERIKDLPIICEQNVSKSKLSDPVYNFEVFANTFKEHYAYFKRNNIKWNSLYPMLKSKITSKTTEAELYLVLEEMLDSLNDNHGYVEPTDEVYELAEKLKKEVKKTEQLKEYGDLEIAELVAEHYLEENLTQDSWLVKWGKMKNNIGYIQVNAMWLYADLNLSDSIIQEKGFVDAYLEAFGKLSDVEQLEAELKGISKTMDKVMEDLSTTRFIILDVRFNGGGNDDVGLEILRRFNPKRLQVATKKARHKNGFSKSIPIFLEAANEPYTNLVYILTSQQSASATDFMALASLEFSNVKRIGSHTNGALSDALEKTLPNGWYFSLSNEEYKDNQGICYESVGIPVDYEVNYPDDRQTFFRSVAKDFELDKKNVLRAIEELRVK